MNEGGEVVGLGEDVAGREERILAELAQDDEGRAFAVELFSQLRLHAAAGGVISIEVEHDHVGMMLFGQSEARVRFIRFVDFQAPLMEHGAEDFAVFRGGINDEDRGGHGMIGLVEGVAGGWERVAGEQFDVKGDQPSKVAPQVLLDLFGPLVEQEAARFGSLLLVRTADAAAHAFAPAGECPFAGGRIERLEPGTAGEGCAEGKQQREALDGALKVGDLTHGRFLGRDELEAD